MTDFEMNFEVVVCRLNLGRKSLYQRWVDFSAARMWALAKTRDLEFNASSVSRMEIRVTATAKESF